MQAAATCWTGIPCIVYVLRGIIILRRPNKAAAHGFKIDLHLVEQTAVKEVMCQPPPYLA